MSLQYISVRKHRYLHITTVVLGLIWIIATADCVQFRRIQARKLHSSLEPDLEDNFSNEDLRKLLTLLEGSSKEVSPKNGDAGSKTSSALEHTATMIMPELMRIRPQSLTSTTTTPNPPVSRFTTRRFYRRLRRKTTTTSTESPLIPSSSSTERMDQTSVASAESPRLLQSGPSPTDLLHQLSLLNGILGALNSSAAAPTATPTPLATNNANDNNNNNNATPVPDILAFLTGAKNIGEASSNHETVVPPPPSPTKGQVEDPTAALALLNLFSGGSSQRQDTATSNNNNAAAAANLLGLMAQAQNAPQPSSPTSAVDNNDAAAALTKLLLQSSAGAPALQGNSISQQQNQNAEASANQLNNLLGLLGTLGGAAQQPQAGGINNLFNLGGDQMAQAQTNSLATLFGSQSQQQSQQAQAQNLLNLFGGNQGGQGQGLSLASLLAPQVGNSIPGLGLLSTVSSLGSSIFSTVSNLFGGSGQNGKPRVRGKGVDTRLGLGYRLGNVGDAQMVWEIGPQLYTDPLRNEARPYTKKRESGLPAAASHYFQPASTTAAEKEMQQIEAKRRMVQAAIQDHYRGNHFESVYPQPTQRRRSHLNYNHFESLYPSSKPKHSPTTTTPPPSSFLSALPFGDHLRGFWSGITSGVTGDEDDATSHFNFDDVRNDFSNNLIKRSSPTYTDYESRVYHPRRMEEDLDDPTHSTLTQYERMLLQYGKGIGVANTKHGVVDDEPQSSESQSQSFFSRWFKGSSSSSTSSNAHSNAQSQSPQHVNSEWGMGASSDEYPTRNPSNNLSPRPRTKQVLRQSQPSAASPYGPDLSYNRRNDVPARANPRRNGGGQRPQKRRSHNPFRNWFSSFKSGGQRPRHGNHPTKGFGRRHFKRPSASNNPKLQHFTNTNKDLMMADANDDFVESAGAESAPAPGYQQPLSYEYGNEFPDVPLTPPTPRRQRPSQGYNNGRASMTQRDRIVEPALLYDHLEATDSVVTEADESFHNRNKVVVNPTLREIEKQKVLSVSKTSLNKATSAALTKAQRLSILKARHNATKLAIAAVKQRVIVKNRGNTRNNIPSGHDKSVSESTTSLPSVMSTISSIFKGTTKPKLLSKLYNATSYLPSIRILPRKKNKDENKVKTKLTLQNGKPAVIVPMNHEDDDEDVVDDDAMETAADDVEPVVQVGHDMSFTDLQSLFGASGKNSTKRKRIRIRVKESVLNGEDTKERKDADEDDDDNDSAKDIFVDIESGEVSVLKPVASLVSFSPKKEEASDEVETDYYEDDDGDGVPDADMKRKEHIFEAIQKQLVNNFEKMKKAQQKAEAKKRRKQELAEKGMDESMDVVTKLFDLHQNSDDSSKPVATKKPKFVGGLSLLK